METCALRRPGAKRQRARWAPRRRAARAAALAPAPARRARCRPRWSACSPSWRRRRPGRAWPTGSAWPSGTACWRRRPRWRPRSRSPGMWRGGGAAGRPPRCARARSRTCDARWCALAPVRLRICCAGRRPPNNAARRRAWRGGAHTAGVASKTREAQRRGPRPAAQHCCCTEVCTRVPGATQRNACLSWYGRWHASPSWRRGRDATRRSCPAHSR